MRIKNDGKIYNIRVLNKTGITWINGRTTTGIKFVLGILFIILAFIFASINPHSYIQLALFIIGASFFGIPAMSKPKRRRKLKAI